MKLLEEEGVGVGRGGGEDPSSPAAAARRAAPAMSAKGRKEETGSLGLI